MDMSMLLRVENVSKDFGGFSALKDVSLVIPEKRIGLLVGPNGSGKTTLFNCISGVLPYTGKIWFNGVCITGKKPWEIVELGIGRSFQIPAPFKNLTVAENLLVCSKDNRGENFSTSVFKMIWDKQEKQLVQKTLKILRILNLEHQSNVLASELSGGQLKLLELGRLLMLDPRLVLFDEPIGGVNPVLAHELLLHIQEVRENFGTTFLLVEHRLDIVMKYVDHVHLMSKGEIVREGTPKKILDSEFYSVYL